MFCNFIFQLFAGSMFKNNECLHDQLIACDLDKFTYQTILVLSFQSSCLLFVFSCLVAVVRTSITTLNRSRESKYLVSFPGHCCFDCQDQKVTRMCSSQGWGIVRMLESHRFQVEKMNPRFIGMEKLLGIRATFSFSRGPWHLLLSVSVLLSPHQPLSACRLAHDPKGQPQLVHLSAWLSTTDGVFLLYPLDRERKKI